MQIPLWIYLLVSAAAIGAIAYAIHRLRPGAPAPMDPDGALKLFRSDHPEAESFSVEAPADGAAFFILSPAGGIVGVVALVGLFWTTRRLGGRDIADVAREGARTRLRFHDLTWPGLTVTWPSQDIAQDWAARFNAMRRPDHA
jgi:hypothetical protein